MSSTDCIYPNNSIPNDGCSIQQWHCIRSTSLLLHPACIGESMPQDYVLSNGQRVERVPRPLDLGRPNDSIPAITFSVNGWAGVRVGDVLNSKVTVDAANDAVFAEHGWRCTVVDLQWPGYGRKTSGDPMSSRIDVRPGGKDITRQNLAREICGLLSSFQKAVSRYPISPEPNEWALTRTAGRNGICVTNVVLFSVHYYRKTWVPEFYVIV